MGVEIPAVSEERIDEVFRVVNYCIRELLQSDDERAKKALKALQELRGIKDE